MCNPGQPGGGYRVRGLPRRTADGTACGAGSQTELVFGLNSVVTSLPPVPGKPNFLDVLRQAEENRNITARSFAFRNRLVLWGITEFAVGVSLAAGQLWQSNGCVVLSAPAGLAGFTAAAVDRGTPQQGVIAGEASEMRGDGASEVAGELPSTTGAPPVSAAGEEPATVPKSTPSNKDNADFVDLLTSPHARHEVRNAVFGTLFGEVRCEGSRAYGYGSAFVRER